MSDRSATARHDLIRLARRELHDLVYRCCRTGGMDPGTADDVARAWCRVAAHHGSGSVAGEHVLELRRDVVECLSEQAQRFLVAEPLLDRLADVN